MDMTSFNKCFGLLCGFVPVMLCGCVSTPSLDESLPKSHSVKESYSVKDRAVYCRLGHDAWYRVVGYNEAAVSVLDTAFSFSDIWQQKDPTPGGQSTDVIKKSWQELLLPLPDIPLGYWGYAATYVLHQKEVSFRESIRFRKAGPAETVSSTITYRPHLDYEAEIGLVASRHHPQRFGYVMVNDLTDRGIQARTFDKSNPGPGFSQAKSFAGSFKAGPLLLIGDEAIWEEIEMTLLVNSETRQQVYGRECMMDPQEFHQDLFTAERDHDWALIGTGTSAGVIFRTPSLMKKLMLLVQCGFNKDKAIDKWLSTFPFLKADDEIEFQSPLLGIGKAKVVSK